MESRTLFERLGGSSYLEKVTILLGEKLKNDQSLSNFFKNVDFKKMNENTKDYLIRLFGGPSNYQGKNLTEVHKPLNLQEGHFNLFLYYFQQAMTELKTDPDQINEATNLLNSTRSEVISTKSLYDRIGGDQLFIQLEPLLGQKILDDNLLGPIYSKTDFQKVNKLRMQYLKSLFGDKSDYKGENMKQAHSKLNLTDQHMGRFVFLLLSSLAELKVQQSEIYEAMLLFKSRWSDFTDRPSPFEQIGGFEALDKIIRAFQQKMKNDSILSPFLEKVENSDATREKAKQFFGAVLGGPLCYTGRSLHDAHSSLGLTDQSVNRYMKLLRRTLVEEGVNEEIIKQFMKALDLFRNPVLGRKSILERMGGMEVLAPLMQKFHESVMKDETLGSIYSKANPQKIVEKYTGYFAYLFGNVESRANGYEESTHKPLNLSDAHYDLFLDIFHKTLKDFNIDKEVICEALCVLERRRSAILKCPSLWERLGGDKAIDKALRLFEESLLKDPLLGPMHKNIDIVQYHENHMDIFADMFGGYHYYAGRSLKEAHEALLLKDEQFDLFVELFQQSLEKCGTKAELLEEVRKKMELKRNEVLHRNSLLEKMGGEPMIDLLVEKLHELIREDPVIGPFHKDVDWAKLQAHRKQFFTQLFGNLSVYQGKDLRTAHEKFNLKDEQFNLFVKLFKTALLQIGVNQELVEHALSLLESTRRDVLNSPSIFEKIGGEEGMMKFVEKLDDVSIKDPKLAPFFEKVDRKKLDDHQFQYFSNTFGGPKMNYEGKSVRTAHENLPLSDEHFKIYLGHTQEVLKEMKVENDVIIEALRLFQNKRDEVLNQ